MNNVLSLYWPQMCIMLWLALLFQKNVREAMKANREYFGYPPIFAAGMSLGINVVFYAGVIVILHFGGFW